MCDLARNLDCIDKRYLWSKGSVGFRNKKKGVIANIATLLVGYSSAEIIALLVYPILSRLYTPEDFGQMSILWAYCSIFSAVACWRLESVIVIEPNEFRAKRITELCLLGALFLSVAVSCFLNLYSYLIPAHFLSSEQKKLLLWAAPSSILAAGIYLTLSYWSVRKENFRGIFFSRLSGVISSALIKIGFGLKVGSSVVILLGANVLSSVVQGVLLLPFYLRSRPSSKDTVHQEGFFSILTEYREFPTIMLSSTLISSLSANLPNIILGMFFSTEIVGFYSFAFVLLVRPIGIISESISKVLLQDLSVEPREKRGQKILNIIVILMLIGIPFLAILGFFGELIFFKIFGSEWLEAGKYAEILSIYIFGRIIVTPAIQLMLVEKQLKFNFWFTVFESTMRLLVILGMSKMKYEPLYIISVYAFVGFIIHSFYILIALVYHQKLLANRVTS